MTWILLNSLEEHDAMVDEMKNNMSADDTLGGDIPTEYPCLAQEDIAHQAGDQMEYYHTYVYPKDAQGLVEAYCEKMAPSTEECVDFEGKEHILKIRQVNNGFIIDARAFFVEDKIPMESRMSCVAKDSAEFMDLYMEYMVANMLKKGYEMHTILTRAEEPKEEES